MYAMMNIFIANFNYKPRSKKSFICYFSDDIDWVKKNMNFGADAIYEDGTDPL